MKKYIVYLFLLAISCEIWGQNIEMRPIPIENNALTENLFQVVITNAETIQYQVYLEGSIIDAKRGKVYEAKTAVFYLNNGYLTVQQSFIQPLQVLMSNLQMNVGDYMLNTKLYEVGSNRLLAELLINKEIKASEIHTPIVEKPAESPKTDELSDLTKINWKKAIQFHGSSRIYTQYAQREGYNAVAPARSYISWEGNPTLSVSGIPININWLLTTLDSSQHQSINRFRVNVDTKQLEYILRQKVEEQLRKAISRQEKVVLAKWENFKATHPSPILAEIDSLKNQLKQPEVQAILTKYKTYQGLKQIVKNPDFEANWQKLANLAKEYDIHSLEDLLAKEADLDETTFAEMKRLYELKAEYQALEAQIKALAPIEKTASKYVKWEEKLKKASSNDLQQYLDSPEKVFEAAKMLGMIDKKWAMLKDWKEIGIGTAYPFWSPLSINGVAVRGANLAWNPNGKWYVAALGGSLERPTQDTLFMNTRTYRRLMWGGKIGYGQKEKTHLYFSGLYGTDKRAENQSIVTSSDFKFPQTNTVIGLDGQLNVWKNRILINGEIQYALLTLNRDAAHFLNPPTNIPFFFKNIANTSSHADWAGTIRYQSKFFNDKTKLSGYYTRIGPGYFSMGVPYLLSDRERYEFRYEQDLFKNKVSINAFFRKDHDNLIPWKSYRTMMLSAGLTCNIHFPKMPFLSINFSPYSQKTDAINTTQPATNQALLSLSAGHTYHWEKANFQSTLAYTHQWNETLVSQQLGSVTANTLNSRPSQFFTLSQSISYKNLRLQISGNHIQSYASDTLSSNMYGGEVAVSISIKQKITPQFSFQMMKDKYLGERLGGSFQCNYQLTKYLNIKAEARRNIFNDISVLNNGYQDWLAYLILGFRW